MTRRNRIAPTEKGAKTLINGSPAAASTAPSSLPSFDESTLSNLTRRIEDGLQKSKANLRSNGRRDRRLSTASLGSQYAVIGSAAEAKSGQRGKKRDRRGDVRVDAPHAGAKKPKERYAEKPAPKAIENGGFELLQEIFLLGGTEEDLKIVAGISSGSEVEVPKHTNNQSSASKPGNALQRDIENFVKGLGISGMAPIDDSPGPPDTKSTGRGLASDGGVVGDEFIASNATSLKASSKTKLQSVLHPQDSRSGHNTVKLKFDPRPDWHAAELPGVPSHTGDLPTPPKDVLERVHQHAKSLLESDNNLYSSAHLSSSSSHRFLSTIMSSGTLSDKISALTLVIQESPVHTTKALESLLGLAKKRSRGQAVTALGAMKDLMAQGVVLPPDRKLKPFVKQPGLLGAFQQEQSFSWKPGSPLPKQLQEAHLVSWAYEDWLKGLYFEMLKVLEIWCNDEVEFARGRAVGYVWELLKEKPEQESNLLRLLVNKLGDPSRKIASKASFLLLQLHTTHPLMKPIIISSMESEVIFRPGQSPHAKYYAIITLNQTILGAREQNVANKLIEIYFGLFIALLKQTDLAKKPDGPGVNKKGQLQGGGGKPGKKALRKAEREEANKTVGEMTEKLISAVLTGVNRAFPFSKTDDSSFEKHLDTLFKIMHSSNFNTSIQALMLVQQLSASKQTSLDRFYRTLYESLLDPRLLTSSKQAMYLNILFRSLKEDLNIERVKAFVKRLLQVTTLHQPPFVCGVLYLVRELEQIFPALGALIDQPEGLMEGCEEFFADAPEGGDGGLRPGRPEQSASGKVDSVNGHSHSPRYDGRKRDPEHSHAGNSCLWELEPFLAHFHPSVALFTARLLRHETMPSKPDLSLHTLIHFLDRFVYRNAKSASVAPRGISIMQPLGGGDSSGILLSARGNSKGLAPVNGEQFWKKRIENVAADEVFFHKYFNQVGKAKATGREMRYGKGSQAEVGNAGEDGNEDEIWRALVDSRPELEGSDEGDNGFGVESCEDNDELDSAAGESADERDEDVEEDTELGLGSSDGDGDALFGSDEDLPSDLDSVFEGELRENQNEGLVDNNSTRPPKRRKLRHLPTFASVDDYADLLADEEE
ncbi:MAG: hypothetical protein M1839_001081 [Geoglossum umbratile]|nr:MAG: hypothetical protein M1839_001081 [Geoglossum umbratile]